MSEKITCSICAWREHCQKRFYIQNPAKCPEFTRDLTLDTKKEEQKEKEKSEESKN